MIGKEHFINKNIKYSIMINLENRPKWITFRNFLQLFNKPSVQECLASELAEFAPKETPEEYILDTQKSKDITKKHCPILLDELRVYDSKDINYWLVSFSGVFVFLLFELMYLIQFKLSFMDLIHYMTWPLIGLLAFYLIYMIIALRLELFKREIQSKFLIKNFFTIPAIMLSLGLLVLQTTLIFYSGWDKSPFLPAFLFVNLTIITAPRENSKSIIVLTFLTLIIMLTPFIFPNNNSIDQHDALQFDNFSETINISTLLFTVVIVFLSRFFSSYKFLKK